MYYSFNWIKQLLPELNQPINDVTDKISRSLAEVEEVQTVGADMVFEIENKALAHRADLFSHIGLAREIATMFNLTVTDHKPNHMKSAQIAENQSINISIESAESSPRYSGVLLENVKITESPEWLSTQLASFGQRSINNVVDVTNYIMWKYGQPMHAFDKAKLQSKNNEFNIHVRHAKEGESIDLIDDTALILSSSDVVITDMGDTSRPIALAGIKGGASTQIDDDTKSILLESANFDMFTIRASSRRLGLRTDASLRFEKGLDPQLTTIAMKEAIYLLTGEEISEQEISDTFPNKATYETKELTISIDAINQYLHIEVETSYVSHILNTLGFGVSVENNDITISIPSFRKDISLKEDVFEEIGRMYDYNNIEPTLPTRLIAPPEHNKLWDFKYNVRDSLVRSGAIEILTYSFVNGTDSGKTTETNAELTQTLIDSIDSSVLKLRNPVDPDEGYIRSSLVPSVLQSVIENAKRYTEFTLFEIGLVTVPSNEHKLPIEPEKLAILTYSTNKDQYKTLKSIKETWQRVCSDLGVYTEIKDLKPMNLSIDGMKGSIFGYEVDISTLFEMSVTREYNQLPASQPTMQDISMYITDETEVGPLVKAVEEGRGLKDELQSQHIQWITSVEVIDLFQNGEMKQQEKKSITLRLTYQDLERSIADKEINVIREKLEDMLQSEFKADIR